MSVKQIIQESINKNPLGVKEALEEALRDRVRSVLEEKYTEMTESKDEDDDEDDYEDEEDDLSEGKTVDDFMSLLKIKGEPKKGSRMNLAGYPFDYDGFEEDEIYLTAVDKEAATGLAKEFRKKGFASKVKGTDVTVMVESFDLSDYTVEELEDFMMSEESEQLDEISKKTLGSYIKKASSDIANKAAEHDVTMATHYGPDARKHRSGLRKDIKKREAGMSKALNRLTK